MADTKYYAWSQIVVGRDEWGRNTEVVSPGTEVTAQTLKANKDQFNEFLEAGVVRTAKYPDMGDFNGSPVEFYREQARRAEENALNQAYESLDQSRAVPPEAGTTGS
jgi:hypothetical protein